MFVSLHVLTACLSPPARTRTNDCFPTACFFLPVFFSFLSTSTDFRAPFSYHFFFTTLQLKYTVTPRPLLFIPVYCFLTIYNTAQHRLTIQFNQLILAIHRFDFFLGGERSYCFHFQLWQLFFFLLFFTFRVVMGSVAWWLSGPLPGGSSLHFTLNSCLYPFFNSIWGLVGPLIRGK